MRYIILAITFGLGACAFHADLVPHDATYTVQRSNGVKVDVEHDEEHKGEHE